jgi:short-subunit dehydrogenase
MKIIITGHTSGIGKFLYDEFLKHGHEVIGVSRSNGYTLPDNVDKIVELSVGCDLFINNTSESQLELLEQLYTRVDKMIIMGSIAGDYHQLIQSQYSLTKQTLAQKCKELSLQPNTQLLHLKISMLEDAVSSDNLISFQELYNTIQFWLSVPRLTNIDFEFKLTPYTLEKLKEKFGATQAAIDYILTNMCNKSKQEF